MKTPHALVCLSVLAFAVSTHAQEPAHPMSQHPAVLVKGKQASLGYDYQAQFYPHPAWMYLETDRHEMGDHPAVIVARRYAEEHAALAAKAAAEPAVTALAREPSAATR
jgi:hypothetical protein